jgi:DNA invertase Pin-like site-specific DNA recombinase
MYLRASTENQNYSTQHQRASISEFAAANNLALISEYVDEGRSGLDIRRRHGLQELMRDVQSGAANFKVIVVYDVSRWGRFQDIDEAAYHEHTCRRAGINVMYCAEQFENDGSPLSALLKGIKRTMAAEYSRELSSKVFRAQCRFIDMGFKQGGHAGYGLRRLSLTADGLPRRALQYGESKSVITDRVVLVRGPDAEVANVHRIYVWYVDDKFSEAAIARMLNVEGVASEFGRPWTFSMVNSVLTNLKYIGTLAYNRRSSKLSARRRPNPRGEWVRNLEALPAIVTPELFARAQEERARRNRRYTSSELLALLRECYERHGRVTAAVIAADCSMPDAQLFKRAFGSLTSGYELAQIPKTKLSASVKTKRAIHALQTMLFHHVHELALAAGSTVETLVAPVSLIINGTVKVRIAVVRKHVPARGRPSWIVKFHKGFDFTIAARYDAATKEIKDYFLLPTLAFEERSIYLKEDGGKHTIRCFTSIDQAFGKHPS